MAEPVLIDLAYAKNIPLVATNEPYFATVADHEAHDALICIAEGRFVSETDRRQLNAEHRFKTRAEMRELFADLPEALASTVEIAERCAFRPSTRAPILPRFSASSTRPTNCASARKQAWSGGSPAPASPKAIPSMNTASGWNSSSASSPR
jgi:DNA polymerase-3 subunit alpha